MAVVGANGCGKSTLLSALAGKSSLAGGDVTWKPGVRVSMVDQRSNYDPTMLVSDAVIAYSSSPQAAATRRYKAAIASGDVEEMQAAMEKMEQTAAWDWETRSKDVLDELGLGTELQGRQVGMLSGGEERRLALACALVDLDNTDVLILDEPTNHLSAGGCDWLQERLGREKDLSVILVTHDRYFLDEVCDEILELDGLGAAYVHPGGWQTFLTRRSERYAKKAATVEAARQQLKRAEAWMARGPSGRGTKNKAQQDAFEETKERASATIAANDGSPTLGGEWTVAATKHAQRGPGAVSANYGLVSLRNATVVTPEGKTVLNQVSFDFKKGMKVGIVGPNGVGKSTFLRALAGELELTSGTRDQGDDVNVGFLAQEPPVWPNPDQRVMQLVAEMTEDCFAEDSMFGAKSEQLSRERATARLLKSLNFAQERWQTPVSLLSGGEARRLQLLRVLSKRPNVLLLDEPTNDLDAVTVDSLETLLKPWKGTVILVSHDRSLLDGVCDLHLVFPEVGGSPRVWQGTHAALREHERREEAARAAQEAERTVAAEKAAPPVASGRKFSTQEQRRANRQLKKLEKQIENVEAALAEVQDSMQEFGSDVEKVMELSEKQTKLEEKLEGLYEQWEEVAAKVE